MPAGRDQVPHGRLLESLSSKARDWRTCSLPSQRQGNRDRAKARGRRGSCNSASRQLPPASSEASTRAMLPLLDQARPRISQEPFAESLCLSVGQVITDLTSITKLNSLDCPSSSRSVYREVSSRVMYGEYIPPGQVLAGRRP